MSEPSNEVIARLKKGDQVFEILVNCDKAMDFKHGKAELDEVLVSDEIFKDIKKGQHASENDLADLFGTDEKRKIHCTARRGI